MIKDVSVGPVTNATYERAHSKGGVLVYRVLEYACWTLSQGEPTIEPAVSSSGCGVHRKPRIRYLKRTEPGFETGTKQKNKDSVRFGFKSNL